MERDAWYSSMRDAADLASPESVGRYAAERALGEREGRERKKFVEWEDMVSHSRAEV